MEENGENESYFRKLSCLEKRKTELALQETLLEKYLIGRDFLDLNSTSYNEGVFAYL